MSVVNVNDKRELMCPVMELHTVCRATQDGATASVERRANIFNLWGNRNFFFAFSDTTITNS